MNNRYRIKYYPANLKRQTSYLDLEDLALRTTKQFTPQCELGEGNYGVVRLFVCGDEKIAVKSPKEEYTVDLTKKKAAIRAEEAKSEFNLLTLAYPNATPYSLHQFKKNADKQGKKLTYKYRMVIPFIEGCKLDKFVEKNVRNADNMASLMLELAKELQRLHESGIIHGDFGARNVLVSGKIDALHINIIDFGMAYTLGGKATTGFIREKSHVDKSVDMADERFSTINLSAHPSQDVFSFCKTMEKILRAKTNNWRHEFNDTYPDVIKFIEQGVYNDAEDRPDLNVLIGILDNTANNIAELTPNLRLLVDALKEKSDSEIRGLLESKPGEYTLASLARVLAISAQHNDYECAGRLIHIKKHKIPLDYVDASQSAILHLFAYINQLESNVAFNDNHHLITTPNAHHEKKTLKAAKFLATTIFNQDDLDYQTPQWKKNSALIKADETLNRIFIDLMQTNTLPHETGLLSKIVNMFTF